jgi:predicted solute-binding protein
MRIGAPAMLCVEPLIHGLADEPGVALERAAPRDLFERLRLGTLDAALLAPMDALRLERGRAIPGLGVVFSGPAETELLLASVELSRIERLASNEDAGALNDWARVILAEWFGVRPTSAGISGADARVVAGAFVEEPDPAFPIRHDLGTLWYERTSLPFVAMLWVARFGAPIPDVRRTLNMAAQRGLAAETGLRQAVSYRIGSEAMEGLRLFAGMAARHGFIEEDSELRFC